MLDRLHYLRRAGPGRGVAGAAGVGGKTGAPGGGAGGCAAGTCGIGTIRVPGGNSITGARSEPDCTDGEAPTAPGTGGNRGLRPGFGAAVTGKVLVMIVRPSAGLVPSARLGGKFVPTSPNVPTASGKFVPTAGTEFVNAGVGGIPAELFVRVGTITGSMVKPALGRLGPGAPTVACSKVRPTAPPPVLTGGLLGPPGPRGGKGCPRGVGTGGGAWGTCASSGMAVSKTKSFICVSE